MAAATDKAAAEKAAVEKAEAERVAAERAAAEKAEADRVAAERAAAEESDADAVTVVMLVGITGTRNGEKWPAVGGTVGLPAHEAAQYIANGYARLPE